MKRLLDQSIPDEVRRSKSYRPAGIAFFFLVLIGLTAAWHWTPLVDSLNVQRIEQWAVAIRDFPGVSLAVIGAFLLGGLIVFPVTIMIGVTAIVFEPFQGFAYALFGCLSSATLNYWIGYKLGRNALRQFAGERANRLSRRLGRRGLIAVVVVRVVPVAPYPIISLVAGASHIRFRDFVLGTVIGMVPAILAITVFADSLASVFKNPQPENFVLLALVVAVIFASTFWLQKRLGEHDDRITAKTETGEGERTHSQKVLKNSEKSDSDPGAAT